MSADNAQQSAEDDYGRLAEGGLAGSPASIPLSMWPMLWADVSSLNLDRLLAYCGPRDRGRTNERYRDSDAFGTGGAR